MVGLVGRMLDDDFPCAPIFGTGRIRIAVAIRQAGINLGQDAIQQVAWQVAPCVWRNPRFDRLHFIAIRI